MNKDTLIIDCQIFQTPAWDRGMGKYSLYLLEEVMQKYADTYKAVLFVFSKRLTNDNDAIDTIVKTCPSAQIVWLDLHASKAKEINKDSKYNQKILEEFIRNNNYKADFLLLSVFQKPTCPAFPRNATKSLLFYDLIPLLYHHKYKPDDNYLSRIRLLFEAETIFTISQTVRNDLNTILGIPISKMVNIDGGPIKRQHLTLKKPNTEIPDRYILMPTGDDIRKNNVLGVKGFEQFRSDYPELKLILTSKFEPNFKVELEKYSKNLVFAGNVSEEELGWLYAHAEMLLFPSEYEGLGLPVLEAILDDKKVVCSDIPVFKEMSKTAFYYFDHNDIVAIADALKLASESKDWASKKTEYKELLNTYSWGNTAKRLIQTLQNSPAADNKNKKPKIAIMAPFPSGYSAIGKVVSGLHPTFSEQFDIDYYFEPGLSRKALRPNYLHFAANVYYARDFNLECYRQYDAVIYHIGNSEYHLETIKNALYLPGYVIIHDTFLDGVFNELQKIGYISARRNETENVISQTLKVINSRCLSSIVNSQLGLIAHSDYAKNAVEEALLFDVPCIKSNLPVPTPAYNVQDQEHRLVHIGLAGILTDRKGLDIIERIASLPQFEDCVIDIFGFNYGQQEMLKKLADYPNIIINTNLSDFEYQVKLEQLDILINYRYEYRGETSLTALEAMRYGTAVIVKDVGWFSELPDKTVVKVQSEEDLISSLTELVADKSLRNEIGKAAQKCTAEMFSPEKYAQDIKSFISAKKSPQNNKIRTALLKESDFKQLLGMITAIIQGAQ